MSEFVARKIIFIKETTQIILESLSQLKELAEELKRPLIKRGEYQPSYYVFDGDLVYSWTTIW